MHRVHHNWGRVRILSSIAEVIRTYRPGDTLRDAERATVISMVGAGPDSVGSMFYGHPWDNQHHSFSIAHQTGHGPFSVALRR